MNKIILEQLKKVMVADLSNAKNNPYNFIIPKYEKDRFEENKCYLIQLDKNLIINNPNSIVQINWNNNTYPQYEYLKIDVCKIMGKMIKVNSIAYDNNTNQDIDIMWSGWLPIDFIKIIKIL